MNIDGMPIRIDPHTWERHIRTPTSALDELLVAGSDAAAVSWFASKSESKSAILSVLSRSGDHIREWLPQETKPRCPVSLSVNGRFFGLVRDGASILPMMTSYVIAVVTRDEDGRPVVRTGYPDVIRHGCQVTYDLYRILPDTGAYQAASDVRRWFMGMACDPSMRLPASLAVTREFGSEALSFLTSPDGFTGRVLMDTHRARIIDGSGNQVGTVLRDETSMDALVRMALPETYRQIRLLYDKLDMPLPKGATSPVGKALPVASEQSPGAALHDDTTSEDVVIEVPIPVTPGKSKSDKYNRRVRRQKAAGSRKRQDKRGTSKGTGGRKRQDGKIARKDDTRQQASVATPLAQRRTHDPNFNSTRHQALYQALDCHMSLVSLDTFEMLTLGHDASSTGLQFVVKRKVGRSRVRDALSWMRRNADHFDAETSVIDVDDACPAFDGVPLDDILCPYSKMRQMTGRIASRGRWTILLPENELSLWLDAHGFDDDVVPIIERSI